MPNLNPNLIQNLIPNNKCPFCPINRHNAQTFDIYSVRLDIPYNMS